MSRLINADKFKDQVTAMMIAHNYPQVKAIASARFSFGTAASIFMMVSALSSCSVVYLLSVILVPPFVGALFCCCETIVCLRIEFVNSFLLLCDFLLTG